jgi:hypothetical protein
LYPPLAAASCRDEVAVDESPAEDRLVSIRMADCGLEGGAPEPTERRSNQGSLLAAKDFMTKGGCRL